MWFWIDGNIGTGFVNLHWAEAEKPSQPSSIYGFYTVENFSGYTRYWFDEGTSWEKFEYGNYAATVTLAADNQVALSDFLQTGLSFYGSYDAEAGTITFNPQYIYGKNQPYVLAKEIWDDNKKSVYNAEEPIVATVDENGVINFDGWTILYLYDAEGTSTYAYFSGVKTSFVKGLPVEEEEDGILDAMIEDIDAPAMYYNLQGMLMNPDNLSPGIYVKKAGSKAQKVLVR